MSFRILVERRCRVPHVGCSFFFVLFFFCEKNIFNYLQIQKYVFINYSSHINEISDVKKKKIQLMFFFYEPKSLTKQETTSTLSKNICEQYIETHFRGREESCCLRALDYLSGVFCKLFF